MKQTKRKKLESMGWKIGTTEEFLQLTPEESEYIEIKLNLSKSLKERRQRKNMTQEDLARLIKSSQSRVAKMEAGDPTVSIDLLIRSLLALGTDKSTLAKMLSSRQL
jgi:ribosome-binding protein aMBF1 (putative translation factor)